MIVVDKPAGLLTVPGKLENRRGLSDHPSAGRPLERADCPSPRLRHQRRHHLCPHQTGSGVPGARVRTAPRAEDLRRPAEGPPDPGQRHRRPAPWQRLGLPTAPEGRSCQGPPRRHRLAGDRPDRNRNPRPSDPAYRAQPPAARPHAGPWPPDPRRPDLRARNAARATTASCCTQNPCRCTTRSRKIASLSPPPRLSEYR